MLARVQGVPGSPHALDSINDELRPQLPQGLNEHKGSEVLQDGYVIELLRDRDKPAPLPRRTDVLVLLLSDQAVIRRLFARFRPAFDHVVAET